MPVNVIDTLKPKNGLSFPVVEAIDVFVDGFDNLADAISHFATDAMIAAINAVLSGKANTSDVNTAVSGLQAQIDQIVISASAESVVAPEVAAARVGADGTSYQTLKARLDAEHTTLSSGLSDTATAVNDIKQNVYAHENITDGLPVSEAKFIKNGVEDSNPNFFTVKNIPVEPNTSYIGLSNNSPFLAPGSFCRFINYYDSNNDYLSCVEDVAPEFRTPANAHFMSITFCYMEAAQTDTKGNYGVLSYVTPIDYTDSKSNELDHAIEKIQSDIYAFKSITYGMPVSETKYIQNGVENSGNNFFTVKDIPIDPETAYKGVSNNSPFLAANSFCRFINYYDSSKNYLSCVEDVPVDFTTPSNAHYMSVTFCYRAAAQPDTKGNYDVLTYVNPIEYTDSKFADVPTNICAGLPILNATYIKEGEYSSINGYFSVEYIPVDSELTYSGISNNASGLSAGCFARFLNYYDENKDYIGCYDPTKDVPINFELPDECAYISVSFYYTDIPNRETGVYGVNGPAPWYNGLTQDIIKTCAENASVWFNKTFVSLGDSITWQDGKSYPSGGTARGYQTILKEQLLFKEYNNMGRSGYPMTDGIPGTVGTVTTGLSITYDEYDLVIIAAGTNDFKLNAPLGTVGIIGDTNFDRETFCGAYRTLLEYILTDKPTIRIVLFTPLQRDNDGYDVNYTNSAGCKLSDYANAIKQIAELYSIPVCDMYANSGFTKLTLSTYTRDGLHPNDTGYQRMGNYAAKFIDSIGV